MIQVYFEDVSTNKLLLNTKLPFVPRVGEDIEFHEDAWTVVSVTWSLGYDEPEVYVRLK